MEVLPKHLSHKKGETLSSLILVDEYPLYTMRFTGSYHDQIEYGFHPFPDGIIYPISPTFINWGCSLFASFDASGSGVYGRNFDWQYSPSLLLFTDPSDGYASVSMVNLAFLHDWGEDIVALTDLHLDDREPCFVRHYLRSMA